MNRFCYFIILAALTPSPSAGQGSSDGHLFDQGLQMTKPNARVPGLVQASPFIGDWILKATTVWNDSTVVETSGAAKFTYMNRGFGIMMRSHLDDYAAGEAQEVMAFITKVPAQDVWAFGQGDTYSRAINVYHGSFTGETLSVLNAMRRKGGMSIEMERMTFVVGDGTITQRIERSTNDGMDWSLYETREYTKTDFPWMYLNNPDGFGKHAEGVLANTDFDFLIGEWTANHDLTFPNGNTAQFPVNSTAVHVLEGNAILEYAWFDVDASFPVAATSILRMYNPAMRRWESLYCNNRSNTLLHFGGRKEGEDIILHQFNASMADVPMPIYVFYDITDGHYLWRADTSTDRGKTYSTNWKINTTRK